MADRPLLILVAAVSALTIAGSGAALISGHAELAADWLAIMLPPATALLCAIYVARR